jgi:O-antigen ligase
MAAPASSLSYGERTPGLGLGIGALVLFGVLCGVGIAVGEVEAMLAAVATIAVAAALIDYRFGAVTLLVLLPISNVWFFPHSMFGFTGLNPINVLAGATFVSFALRGRFSGFLPKPLVWLYLVPILVAGLIGSRHVDDIVPYFYENMLMHFSDAGGYLRDLMLKPLMTVLIALLVGAAVARSKKPERFIAPVIVSVWLMSLIAIGFVVASGVRLGALSATGAREFFSAIGMHANDLGRLYAVAYALLLFTWGETKDTALKTVLVVTMGVLTIALILTFSRGAFAGFVLINALFLVWRFNARTFGLALLVVGAAAVIMPGFIMSRVMLGFGEGGDANAVSAGRIDEIWIPLIPDFLHTPPWGNGLDSIMWSGAAWQGTMLMVGHPHSAYLQAYLDMGAIGLVLLLAYFVTVWRGFRDLGSNAYLSPALRGFFQGATAGLLCFFATGFAGSSLRPSAEFAFLWIAIGMMYGMQARMPGTAAKPQR